MDKVYRSKVDWWLWLVISVGVIVIPCQFCCPAGQSSARWFAKRLDCPRQCC